MLNFNIPFSDEEREEIEKKQMENISPIRCGDVSPEEYAEAMAEIYGS